MHSNLSLVLTFFTSLAVGCLGAFFFYGFTPVAALRKPWAVAAELDGLEDDYLSFLAILPVSMVGAITVMNGVEMPWFVVVPILIFHRLFLKTILGSRSNLASSFLKRKKHWRLTLYDGTSLAVTVICSSLVAQACLQAQ
jgi:hypothetical protein